MHQELKIIKGKTFNFIVRWETSPIVYKAITASPQVAPARLTVPGHGAPNGWSGAVTSVKGQKQINAKHNPPWESDYVKLTYIDADTLELNSVNAALFDAYTSGGYLQYNTPQSLANYTARLSVKNKKASVTANLWETLAVYPADSYVVLTNGLVLHTVAGGTSGATQPAAAGTDGTVAWTVDTSYTGSKELFRFTTENTRIVLDDAAKTILLTVSATDSAALEWSRGVFDLEMVSQTGVVTLIMDGPAFAELEVTT